MGKRALDEIDAQTESRTDQSVVLLGSEGRSELFVLKGLIDLHNVKTDKFPFMCYFSYNMVGFDRPQSSSKLGTSSKTMNWFNRINIKRNMERFISNRIQIVNGLPHYSPNSKLHNMVHCETLYVVLLETDPLVRVDVSDAHEDQVLEGNDISKPFEAGDEFMRESEGVSAGIAVVAVILAVGRVDEVRVGIHPYNF